MPPEHLGVIAFLVYSPTAVVDDADPEHGFVFSTIMYVFQYVEAVLAMPLFIQQLIRLSEISNRLAGPDTYTPQLDRPDSAAQSPTPRPPGRPMRSR